MRLGTGMFSSVNMKSVVFGSVIVFACVAFIFTGFGSLHIGSLGSMSPNIAASVGDLTIDMNDLSRVMNQQGLTQVTGLEKKYVINQIIQNLVNQKILNQEALKIGWQASDGEIASLIKSIPYFHDPKTNEFSLDSFKRYVSMQQISEIDFYNLLRSQIEVEKIQMLTALPIVFSDAMVKQEYDIRKTQFNLQYAVINIPEKTIEEKVKSESQKYANDPANLKSLQDMYAAQKDQWNQKAQTRVRSILVSYQGANRAQGEALKRSKDQALQMVQSLSAKVKSGKSFAELASDVNDDENAKRNKGDLGFVDDSVIDSVSMQAIALLTAQKPLSDVVDTPFGYRLFQYEDFHPALTKSFDQVKADLAQRVVGNQIKIDTENKFIEKLNLALASKDISAINNLLVDNGVTWQYLGKSFDVNQTSVPELGNTNQLAESVFSLHKSGDLLTKIIDFGSKKALIKLVSIQTPTEPKPEDLTNLAKQMSMQQNQMFSQKLVEFLKENYEKKGKIKVNPILNES